MRILGTDFDEREASIALVCMSALSPDAVDSIVRDDKEMEFEIKMLILKSCEMVTRNSWSKSVQRTLDNG